MSSSKVIAAGLLALLASTVASRAGVVYDEKSFGPAATNWGNSSNTPSFNPLQALDFNGFNTALGTLTSVVISFTEDAYGTVNMTNRGTDSSEVDAYLLNLAKLKVPALATKTLTDISTDYDAYLAPSASSGPLSVTGSVSSAQYTITTASDLANYIVPWSALVGELGGVQVSSDNGNGSAVYTDYGQITVDVAYYYNASFSVPAPEPATIFVLGTALLGISGTVRRRRPRNSD